VGFLRGEHLGLRDAFSALARQAGEGIGATFHGFGGGNSGSPIDYIFGTDDVTFVSTEVRRGAGRRRVPFGPLPGGHQGAVPPIAGRRTGSPRLDGVVAARRPSRPIPHRPSPGATRSLCIPAPGTRLQPHRPPVSTWDPRRTARRRPAYRLASVGAARPGSRASSYHWAWAVKRRA